MISTGYNHDPPVIVVITNHFRITEIPTSRLISIIAGISNNNWTFLGIFPSTTLVLAVCKTDTLIPIRAIGIIGSVVGN
ncbi:hypothetical protein D3C71_1380130 [compost metagenome]